jgi:hypothetical protein
MYLINNSRTHLLFITMPVPVAIKLQLSDRRIISQGVIKRRLVHHRRVT